MAFDEQFWFGHNEDYTDLSYLTDEHKKLMDKIYKLYDNCSQRADKNQWIHILDDLNEFFKDTIGRKF